MSDFTMDESDQPPPVRRRPRAFRPDLRSASMPYVFTAEEDAAYFGTNHTNGSKS